MNQVITPDEPVMSNQARLVRWGFAMFVVGFMLLLTDLFQLDGLVWQALILLVAIIIMPESKGKISWPKRLLFFIGSMLGLIALVFLAAWVEGKTGIGLGIILTTLALLAGIVCQLLGGILSPTGARPASGLSSSLTEKIRGL